MGGAGVSDDVMCVCARGGSVSFGRPGIVGARNAPGRMDLNLRSFCHFSSTSSTTIQYYGRASSSRTW